jgi:hypothetical protein
VVAVSVVVIVTVAVEFVEVEVRVLLEDSVADDVIVELLDIDVSVDDTTKEQMSQVASHMRAKAHVGQ